MHCSQQHDFALQFLRLGFEGYKKIMTNLMEVSAHLAKGILATGEHWP